MSVWFTESYHGSLHCMKMLKYLLIADDYARVTRIRSNDFTIASTTHHDSCPALYFQIVGYARQKTRS